MSKFFNLEKGIYARDKTVVYPERTIRCIGHTFWPISKRGVLPTLTCSFARHSFLLGLGLVFSISTCQCSLHTLKSLWGDSLCISLKELLCLQSCHKKTSTLDGREKTLHITSLLLPCSFILPNQREGDPWGQLP